MVSNTFYILQFLYVRTYFYSKMILVVAPLVWRFQNTFLGFTVLVKAKSNLGVDSGKTAPNLLLAKIFYAKNLHVF